MQPAGKPFWHNRTSMAHTSGTRAGHPRRMLKKTVLVVREARNVRIRKRTTLHDIRFTGFDDAAGGGFSASCESKRRSDIAHQRRAHMHLVSVQRLACSLPAASRLHSLTFRHLAARQPRPCVCLLCPRLAWLLGLMPIAGLSSYRPASFDNAPNLDPRAWEGKITSQRLGARG